MRTGKPGIELIKAFEGCAKLRPDGKYQAYPDPGTGGDPWTIGWGTTGPDVKPGVIWTRQECDDRFINELRHYEQDVMRAIGDRPTTQNQFDALVAFHYNTGKIRSDTLTKKHKAAAYAEAKAAFAKWCYAGGQVMRGLQRRRAAEAKLYGTP